MHRWTAGRILILVMLVGLTVIVASRFTDLRDFLGTLAHGDWKWIAAGMLIHGAFFYAYAILYRIGFAVVGIPSRTNALFPLVFAGIFVDAVLPLGGAGSAALFVDDAARRGHSASRATVGVILVLIADLITLTPFLAWGVAFLARHHDFAVYHGIAVGMFVGYIAVLIAALVLSKRHPASLRRILGRIRSATNAIGRRFGKRELLDDDWVGRTQREFCETAQAIVRKPAMLAGMAAWAVVVHIINAGGIWALVKAFGTMIPISGLIAAFGFGFVFFVVAPIPQGAAVVEAVIALILKSLGIPKTTAVTIALLFRGANFWIPLLVGLLFFRTIRRFGERIAKA